MKKLSKESILEQMGKLGGWKYIDGALETTFTFKDFKEAFSTMTKIAFECEAQNHHPDWTNVYNTLRIRLNTHDANGVTHKDFDLADSIEKIVMNKELT